MGTNQRPPKRHDHYDTLARTPTDKRTEIRLNRKDPTRGPPVARRCRRFPLSSGHMAPGPPVIAPPRPPTPTGDDGHEHLRDDSFLGDASPTSTTPSRTASPRSNSQYLATPTNAGSSPRPQSQLLQLPPTFIMSDEDGNSAAPANPFNFQTQVISTSPVKSVS